MCIIDENKKTPAIIINRSFFVPKVGIEPTRHCCHWILSPARLPIPPLRQLSGGVSVGVSVECVRGV